MDQRFQEVLSEKEIQEIEKVEHLSSFLEISWELLQDLEYDLEEEKERDYYYENN